VFALAVTLRKNELGYSRSYSPVTIRYLYMCPLYVYFVKLGNGIFRK